MPARVICALRPLRRQRPLRLDSVKTYVEHIVRALVDHPESLKIASLEGKNTVVVEVRCHRQDIGRVIGRNGKTITAVRTLMAGLASRQRRKAMLEVME